MKIPHSACNGHAKRRRHRRRGMVLFIVFLVVTSATLIATGLIYSARAEAASASRASLESQLRSLAWSGVQAVMSELDAARPEILQGATPEVTQDWSLYGTGDERGVVRLLPVGPAGEWLVSESAKLNVNQADVDRLALLEMITPELAQAIVAARNERSGGRFDSLNDLLDVEGITPEFLWGESQAFRVPGTSSGSDASDFGSSSSIDIGEEASSFSSAQIDAVRGFVPPRGLADLLTIYAWEPRLQETGRYKININAPWDDRMFRRIEQRFGTDIANLAKAVKERDENFNITEAQLCQILAQGDDTPEEWDGYVDAITDSDDRFYRDRIDLNRARAEVLATVPGIDRERAELIATERDAIPDSRRNGTSWLVDSQVMTNQEWATSAPHLSTRTFAWRVRVLARILRGGIDRETTVEAEAIYEAVIDLSMPRPRLAYLRDISMLEMAGEFFGAAGTISITDEVESKPIEAEDGLDDEVEDDGSAPLDSADRGTLDGNNSMRGFEMNDADDGESDPADQPIDASGERDASNTNDDEGGNAPESTPLPPQTPPGRWNRGG